MSTVIRGKVYLTPFLLLSLLLVIQIPLIVPFFHDGFFPTHDGIQTIRIFEYYQSLKFGAFPPRWASGLLYGYGYPLFVFYNPMVYLLGSMFVFAGFNFLIATKIVFILGFLLGVAGIFLLLREFTDNLSAFVGSIIYSLAPYRAVDVYVRGDLAEFFDFSLFPLIFWINLKLFKSQKDPLLIYALSVLLALLILSHNISAFIYLIFLLGFNIFYIFVYTKKKRRIEVFRKLLGSVFLSLTMSCFYWLPLLVEIRFVQIDRVNAFSYAQYFLTLEQIWQSAWGFGGFLQENPMSLQLGKMIILLSFLALFLNIFIKTKMKKMIFFIGLVFICSTLLETQSSQFVWKCIPLLGFLQFPWRLHILSTVCGVILVGFFIYQLENLISGWKKEGKILILVLVAGVIWLSYEESHTFFKEKYFIEDKPVAETTTGEEYLPRWVKTKPSSYPPDKVVFLKGSGWIENLEWGYHQKTFTAISSEDARIRLEHIYYPGWTAYVNTTRVEIDYSNEGGAMEINLPKGRNVVSFVFRRTWWGLIADVISLMGGITALVLVCKSLILGRLHPILLKNGKKN